MCPQSGEENSINTMSRRNLHNDLHKQNVSLCSCFLLVPKVLVDLNLAFLIVSFVKQTCVQGQALTGSLDQAIYSCCLDYRLYLAHFVQVLVNIL